MNLEGQRFGRLIAASAQSVQQGDRRRVLWLCRCDCGGSATVESSQLVAGIVRSCGCLRKDTTRARSLKHGASVGHRRTREYRAWLHMKGRCLTPTDHKFPLYGGRGIGVDPEWIASFDAFMAHMGPCPPGSTLDRIDVNGDYAPGNCRWATPKQQANNTRENVIVVHRGTAMTLKRLAESFGVNYKSLHCAVRTRGHDPIVAVKRLARKRAAHA